MGELPVTVPMKLHEDIAAECGQPFAVSYLCGAVVDNGKLFPRTRMARERLMGNSAAMVVLKLHGLIVGAAQPPGSRLYIPAITAAVERYDRTGKF